MIRSDHESPLLVLLVEEALHTLYMLRVLYCSVTYLTHTTHPLNSQLTDSGYISAGPGKFAHYIFSQSLTAPATDPVLAWVSYSHNYSIIDQYTVESTLLHSLPQRY